MRYPDWDPRSWSEAYRDPPTRPLPTQNLATAGSPIYDALIREGGPSMGRHTDADGNHVADWAERTFSHDDGSTYQRVPATEIEDCDDVDSTTIVDEGAPE